MPHTVIPLPQTNITLEIRNVKLRPGNCNGRICLRMTTREKVRADSFSAEHQSVSVANSKFPCNIFRD